MKLYYPITVDLYNTYPLPVMKAQQNNVGRGAMITLTANGEVVVSTEETVRIFTKRPDGFVSYLDCSILEDGKIQADFTDQMLSAKGSMKVELEFTTESTNITTPIFIVEVQESNIQSAVKSSNEFKALESYAKEAVEAANIAKAGRATVITQKVSGEVPTTTDAAPVPPLNIIPYGKSEQRAYEGYQLFDASKFDTESHYGVSVTNNGDGSFTLSGSGILSDTFAFNDDYTHEETIELLKAGNLNCDFGNMSYPNFYFQLVVDGSAVISMTNRNSSTATAEITQSMLDNESSFLRVGFFGAANTNIVPNTMKPMLYQDGNGTWEPYVGNAPSPSMAYPQPIVSAGQRYITGAQLFDKQLLLDNGGVEQEDGSIYMSHSLFRFYVNENNESGQFTATVTLKRCQDTNCFLLHVIYTDGTEKWLFDYYEFTTNEYGTVTVRTDASKTVSEMYVTHATAGYYYIKDFMVSKGTEVKPYEPYTGGVAKVIDVGIEQKLLGGNVLDIPSKALLDSEYYGVNDDGSLVVKALDGRANGDMPITHTFKAGTYTLSIPEDEKNSNLKIELYDVFNKYYPVNWTFGTSHYVGFTLASDTEVTLKVIMTDYTTVGFACHLMINKGTEPLPFTPYVAEQTLSIPYVLREGDKIPYAEGKRVETRYRYYLTEDDIQYIGYMEDAESGNMFYLGYQIMNKLPKPSDDTESVVVMSNMARGIPTSQRGNKDFMSVYNMGGYIYFRDAVSNTLTLEEFKSKAVNLYVEYVLADPIETDLTDEDIAQYEALVMNKGYNTLVNDAGCVTEVEYVCDTQLHIEQNYTPNSVTESILERLSNVEAQLVSNS